MPKIIPFTKKCPKCRGAGLQQTRIRQLLTTIPCKRCRGRGTIAATSQKTHP